jgi:hypothetical protein
LRDISEDAAVIADMMRVVKARFVEAFDTEDHVGARLVRPATERSFWPATQSDSASDDPVPNVWRPKAAAISRSNEVLQGWLIDFVPDLEHRRLLLAWSASIATPARSGSFARFCKKSGRVRRTADRRLLEAFSVVAALIRKNGKSLQAPDWNRVSTLARNSATDLGKVANDVSVSPTSWMADGAKPVHHADWHEA